MVLNWGEFVMILMITFNVLQRPKYKFMQMSLDSLSYKVLFKAWVCAHILNMKNEIIKSDFILIYIGE